MVMKKLFYIFLSCFPLIGFSKSLNFVNNSSLYMDFILNTGGECRISINPVEFQLLPGKSQKVAFEIPECLMGERNSPGITITGWASKYPSIGHNGFKYLAQFMNDLSLVENQWSCTKNTSGVLSYYCYHAEQGDYQDFLVEANENTILISNPNTSPSEDGFYTFYNDTDETFFSISSMDGASKKCSGNSVGAIQPKSKYNFSYQEMSKYCYKNPKACKIEVYKDKNCSTYPIGTIALDLDAGVISTHNNPHQPGESSYRISYESSPTHIGQDIHLAKTIVYGVWNKSREGLELLINDSYCTTNEFGVVGPSNIVMLNSPWPRLWYLCEDPTSCKISFHILNKNTKGCLGSSIGYVILDIDNGIKEISMEPLGAYEIFYEDSIPGVSQQIIVK